MKKTYFYILLFFAAITLSSAKCNIMGVSYTFNFYFNDTQLKDDDADKNDDLYYLNYLSVEDNWGTYTIKYKDQLGYQFSEWNINREGYDKNPYKRGNNTTATISSLPSGTYDIVLKADEINYTISLR